MEVLNFNRAVYGDYIFVPFEVAQHFKEFAKYFHFIRELKFSCFWADGVAVQNKNEQCVQTICSHAGKLGTQH